MLEKLAAPPVITDPEQSLCVRCGLCCNGTIFEWARVFEDDDLTRLTAERFVLLATPENSRFALPCHHQQGRVCSIYRQWRPQICHTFRCALLRRLAAGEVAWDEAHAIIERTVALAERIEMQLPAPGDHERKSLKARMAAWRAAQSAAGVDVQRAFAPLLLDYASLQRLLDRHFRLKAAGKPPVEKAARDTEPFTAMEGEDHA